MILTRQPARRSGSRAGHRAPADRRAGTERGRGLRPNIRRYVCSQQATAGKQLHSLTKPTLLLVLHPLCKLRCVGHMQRLIRHKGVTPSRRVSVMQYTKPDDRQGSCTDTALYRMLLTSLDRCLGTTADDCSVFQCALDCCLPYHLSRLLAPPSPPSQPLVALEPEREGFTTVVAFLAAPLAGALPAAFLAGAAAAFLKNAWTCIFAVCVVLPDKVRLC